MVRGLAKVAGGIAFVGFTALELGSPLWTRAQLDGTAHDAADDAAYEFVHTNSRDQAYAVAVEDVSRGGAKLEEFFFDDAGAIHVTVSKRAKSYLLHNFEKTRGWHQVQLRATAMPEGR